MLNAIKSMIAIISICVFSWGLSDHKSGTRVQIQARETKYLIHRPMVKVNAIAAADAAILKYNTVKVLKYEAKQQDYKKILLAIASAQTKAQSQKYAYSRRGQIYTHSISGASGSTLDIMQCIKDHESGNYSESSHTGSGSGAYQYIPNTWRNMFGMWATATGYSGPYYSLAYLAPAYIQDAVTKWAIENGHAGNWSPKYGNDPCTVGIGG